MTFPILIQNPRKGLLLYVTGTSPPRSSVSSTRVFFFRKKRKFRLASIYLLTSQSPSSKSTEPQNSFLSCMSPCPPKSPTGTPSQRWWRAGDDPIAPEGTTARLPLGSNLTSYSSNSGERDTALLVTFYEDNTSLLGHFPGTRSGK